MPGGRLRCALLAAFAAVAPCAAFAQITVDGTLSPARSLAGPHYSITADLGQQLGANLFHSFGQFNLSTGESATFSGPNSVANIIARVTGGSVSSINGTIASTIPGASLFLINPAGLMFGSNAQVNVSGSFHATTADYLRFADGAGFSASTPSGSTLTTAAPSAFGFLSSNPAGLSINGSTLSVPTGQQLSLVGGPVTINGGTIQAAGGAIHVASASGPGQIPIDPTNAVGVTAPLGSVNIAQGSAVDASASGPGQSGGQIYIRGGVVAIDASTVETANEGAGTGGGIAITGSTSITLSSFSDVEIDNSGSGAPGSILLQGGAITMSGFSTVLSQNNGPGQGAPVTLNGTDMTLTNGAQVTSSAFATGNGGDITVTASGSVTIDGSLASPFGTNTGFGTMVQRASAMQPRASGNAGNITVSVADTLTILAGGAISSETAEVGNAGNVTVTAGSIVADDASAIFGGIGSIVDSTDFYVFLPAQPPDNAIGSGGNVTVQAAQISITGSAQIGTFGYGSGNVGNVTVSAGTLVIDGSATPGVATGINTLAIDSNLAGGGAAIDVTAADIVLLNGGTITALTEGMGQSGNITVTTTGGLTMANNGQIVSITNSAATGKAGSVSVTAPAIAITNTGEIGSNTFGSADAGAVTVKAGTISIVGQSASNPGPSILTGIASDAELGSTGNAGSVKVAAGQIDLYAGGVISSTTFGSGQGGQVIVTASSILANGSQAIDGLATGIAANSDASASGDGGVVVVDAGSVTLQNGGTIASTSKGTGNGGSVTTTAGNILIEGSNAIGPAAITAAAVGPGVGSGGTVTISAANLTLLDGGLVSTRADPLTLHPTSHQGGGGDLVIHASKLVDLSSSAITTSVRGGDGNGGNITIDPPALVLKSSSITANAFGGNGGNILIDASLLLLTPDSFITASSQLGISGTITVNAPANDVTAGMTPLSGRLAAAQEIARAGCADVIRREKSSSLAAKGQGGLPPDASEPLSVSYLDDMPVAPLAVTTNDGSAHVASTLKLACR